MDFYNQKWVMWFAPKSYTNFAITLGSRCFYSVPKVRVSDSWRKHEDCHKAQFKRCWYIGFPFVYCFGYIWNRLKRQSHLNAYRNIPFEIEARKAEL